MRRFRSLSIAIAACLTASVAAETVTLTAEQMRLLAVQATAAGDHAAAMSLADALLRRDPEDVDALVLKSRAARDGGDTKLARKTAQTAWRHAETEDEKYAAALVRAQALATSGARTRAQMWLRRAAHAAPSEKLRDNAVRDFKYVRSRNRFQTQLSFSISPVSNLNNGSTKDTGLYDIPFFGTVEAQLNGAARALSGIETAVGISSRFRFVDLPKQKSDVILSWSNRQYTLSEEAKEIAPDAKGSDFDLTSVSVTLAHMGQIDGAPGPFRLSAGISQTWYGGEEYTRTIRASARQDVKLSRVSGLYAQIGFSSQDALDRTWDAESFEYKVGINHRFGDGNQLRLAASRKQSNSVSSSLDYISHDLEAGLRLGKPLLGMGFDFGLSIGRKKHDGSVVRGLDREEESMGGSVTAVIEPLELYGFVPTITLEGRKVDSNLSQYDREEFGVRLGLRSSF